MQRTSDGNLNSEPIGDNTTVCPDFYDAVVPPRKHASGIGDTWLLISGIGPISCLFTHEETKPFKIAQRFSWSIFKPGKRALRSLRLINTRRLLILASVSVLQRSKKRTPSEKKWAHGRSRRFFFICVRMFCAWNCTVRSLKAIRSMLIKSSELLFYPPVSFLYILKPVTLNTMKIGLVVQV